MNINANPFFERQDETLILVTNQHQKHIKNSTLSFCP